MSMLGRWVKYGQQVDINPSTESLFCDSCFMDYNLRRKYYQEMNLKNTNRSYQVPGVTFARDLWPWEFSICHNSQCWGKAQRIFDVKRKENRYQFTHSKTVNGVTETVLDRQYFNVFQENPSSSYNLSYSGIGMKNKKPLFFWPNFLLNEPQNATYYFYVYLNQMQRIPQDLKSIPISCRPHSYQTSEYKYPFTMRIEIFRENCDSRSPYPIPTTYSELQNHFKIGKTFIELYPGTVASFTSRGAHDLNLGQG